MGRKKVLSLYYIHIIMYLILLFLFISLILFYQLRSYEKFETVDDDAEINVDTSIKTDEDFKKEGVEVISDGRYGGYPSVFPDIGDNSWNVYWDLSKREMVPMYMNKYFDFSSPFVRKDL